MRMFFFHAIPELRTDVILCTAGRPERDMGYKILRKHLKNSGAIFFAQ